MRIAIGEEADARGAGPHYAASGDGGIAA